MKLLTLKDVYKYADPEYIVDEILYRKTLTLLTAYAGDGKSLVSMSIAQAVVTGKRLWGHFEVGKQGLVIIVDEENPPAFLKDRVRKMGFKEDASLYYLHYQGFKFDNPVSLAILKKIVEEYKPELIIFDSLIRFHSVDENNNTEMAQVMEKAREIVNLGTSVMIIHHDRKGFGERKERVRGGGDILGAVDCQLCLEVLEDGNLLVTSGKTRMSPIVPIKLKFNITEDKLEIRYVGRHK